VFAGKALTAIAFAICAVAALALSSIAAGALVIGRQPLVDLSGLLRPAPEASVRVALAWASVLPPVIAFTAVAVLTSVVTRSSAAGIGLPVVLGLTFQLSTLIDGPEAMRRLLMSSAFGAWHGFLTEPPYFGPFFYATAVSAAYAAGCLVVAYCVLRRRDVAR
jgi:ABC-2 type transport system permease protein